ncbi:molybdenum cofactor guanylyltransferase [Niabella beijingensis]|uniref:molybdenum cofactor guanylyltransferase n=1 Tax=Niabella beijingensis TaxID=2872700 RepID=UPI001CBB8732|nr:molybdenum cofactor guanylyltransferase [Niabella beijingensis]MBZ4191338.1 molybdenum cofactor guanylyltransferase [Niabella beijingensis]
MLGIVLCGGKSTRMGSDKGLLQLKAQTWAKTAAAKFEVVQLPVRISVNTRQQPAYARLFEPGILITDDSHLPVKGPLLGLLSAHLRYPDHDLFVLACDMPLIDPSLLKELYQAFDPQKADAFIFTNSGAPEPLCSIYTAPALGRILNKAQKNELPKFSLKYVLEQLNTSAIPIREDQKSCFRNFNIYTELNNL